MVHELLKALLRVSRGENCRQGNASSGPKTPWVPLFHQTYKVDCLLGHESLYWSDEMQPGNCQSAATGTSMMRGVQRGIEVVGDGQVLSVATGWW